MPIAIIETLHTLVTTAFQHFITRQVLFSLIGPKIIPSIFFFKYVYPVWWFVLALVPKLRYRWWSIALRLRICVIAKYALTNTILFSISPFSLPFLHISTSRYPSQGTQGEALYGYTFIFVMVLDCSISLGFPIIMRIHDSKMAIRFNCFLPSSAFDVHVFLGFWLSCLVCHKIDFFISIVLSLPLVRN